MYLLKILQLSFILLPVFSFGQLRIPRDTLLKTYDHQTILLLSTGVMQDGHIQKFQLFVHPLKKAVRNDPMALALFQKSNLQLFGGSVCMGAGVLPLTLGLVNLGANRAFSQKEATAMALGGAAAFGLGIWLGNKARNGFNETAWLYNRNALLRGLHRYSDSTNQAQITRSYDQNSIRRTQFGFYQNGHYHAMGSFGFYDPLKNKLRPNVMAYSLYQRGNSYRNTGTVLGYVSVLGSMSALSQILNATQFNTTTFRNASLTSLVSTALGIIGSVLIVNGENEIQKAVWFYNRDAFVNGVF